MLEGKRGALRCWSFVGDEKTADCRRAAEPSRLKSWDGEQMVEAGRKVGRKRLGSKSVLMGKSGWSRGHRTRRDCSGTQAPQLLLARKQTLLWMDMERMRHLGQRHFETRRCKKDLESRETSGRDRQRHFGRQPKIGVLPQRDEDITGKRENR